MKGNGARWWLILGIAAAVYTVVAFALPFARGGVFWVSYLFALAALEHGPRVSPAMWRVQDAKARPEKRARQR